MTQILILVLTSVSGGQLDIAEYSFEQCPASLMIQSHEPSAEVVWDCIRPNYICSEDRNVS